MNDNLSRFEQLLKDMEASLIANDMKRVEELTAKQQQCLVELVREAKADPSVKERVKAKMTDVQSQLKKNNELLEQAISITNAVALAIHKRLTRQGNFGSETASRNFSA